MCDRSILFATFILECAELHLAQFSLREYLYIYSTFLESYRFGFAFLRGQSGALTRTLFHLHRLKIGSFQSISNTWLLTWWPNKARRRLQNCESSEWQVIVGTAQMYITAWESKRLAASALMGRKTHSSQYTIDHICMDSYMTIFWGMAVFLLCVLFTWKWIVCRRSANEDLTNKLNEKKWCFLLKKM